MKRDGVYKKMYSELFNSVSEALEILRSDPELAEIKLKAAQLQCEQLYINAVPQLRKKQKKDREDCGICVSFF